MAKRINKIGQMREVIEIYTALDTPFGEYSLKRGHTLVHTLRAKKKEVSGTARRNGIGEDATISHVFTIRRGPDPKITTVNILKHDDDYFYIRAVQDKGAISEDTRDWCILLYCELDAAAGALEEPSPEEESEEEEEISKVD